jgi:hypothetical protein
VVERNTNLRTKWLITNICLPKEKRLTTKPCL